MSRYSLDFIQVQQRERIARLAAENASLKLEVQALTTRCAELTEQLSGARTDRERQGSSELQAKYAQPCRCGHLLWEHAASLGLRCQRARCLCEEFAAQPPAELDPIDL